MSSARDEHDPSLELRRVRDTTGDALVSARAAEQVLPAPLTTGVTPLPERPADPPGPPEPVSPDTSAVNTAWDLQPHVPQGFLSRLLRRVLQPLARAQTTFNSHQVQLDNALVTWIEARFAHTHRHYDTVLGLHGRHLQEIDQRHLQLQADLVAHVHDLVQRIDLVLAESERSRVSAEVALRDLRRRLGALEERLRTSPAGPERE